MTSFDVNLPISGVAWWCNGNGLDWWSKGPRIDSEPEHCQVRTLSKLFKDVCLCLPSGIIWYQPKGGDAPRLGR